MQHKLLKRLTILTVACFGLLTVTAAPPPHAKGPDKASVKSAIKAKDRHAKSLLDLQGVIGTGVGWNKSNGKGVIKVYTNSMSTSAADIPQSLDGFDVQVQYIGVIYALKGNRPADKKPRKGKNRVPAELESQASQSPLVDERDKFSYPLPIGVSTGHPDITAGTIGCRVSQGCHVYALSNNHVFADENNANLGDNILQPGKFDGGSNPADAYGTLYDYVPLEFKVNPPPYAYNYVDAAIAEVSGTVLGNATTEEGYGVPKSEIMAAYLGQKVMKYGRTTGLTYGYVTDTSVTVDVGYDDGTARFTQQIFFGPADDADYTIFSDGGDSGSLIVGADSGYPQADCVGEGTCSPDYPPVNDERKPVALLFAGGGAITVGNPIEMVLDAFDVVIDGE